MKRYMAVISLFCIGVANCGAMSGEPEIYADISQEAQEDSVKFEGMRLLAGLLYAQNKLTFGLAGSETTAGHSMGLIGATIGGEYAKSFKKNFWFAVNLSADITKKCKKIGSWKEINPAYEENKGSGGVGEKRDAQFETASFVPSVSVKVGYQLKPWTSLVFLEAGCSFAENVKCRYSKDGRDFDSCEMTFLVPKVGLGVEKKFNSKWSTIIKANMSLNRKSKKIMGNTEHQVKMRRISASIMAVFTTKSE